MRSYRDFPVYLKALIGTASTRVYRVTNAAELQSATDRLAEFGAFDNGGVIAQTAVDGPLVMIQSVFDSGRLVAWHSNLRAREGSGGGASSKQSIDLQVVRVHLERLGDLLGWHGALSLDAILDTNEPRTSTSSPALWNPRMLATQELTWSAQLSAYARANILLRSVQVAMVSVRISCCWRYSARPSMAAVVEA